MKVRSHLDSLSPDQDPYPLRIRGRRRTGWGMFLGGIVFVAGIVWLGELPEKDKTTLLLGAIGFGAVGCMGGFFVIFGRARWIMLTDQKLLIKRSPFHKPHEFHRDDIEHLEFGFQPIYLRLTLRPSSATKSVVMGRSGPRHFAMFLPGVARSKLAMEMIWDWYIG